MKTWKDEVEEYYFNSHMFISDIAIYTGISRQSISAHLKMCPGYEEEKEWRKTQNRKSRKEYKKVKNREYRSRVPMEVTADTMRREHEIAVMILSHEKYH